MKRIKKDKNGREKTGFIRAKDFINSLKKVSPVPVEFGKTKGDSKGFYSPDQSKIVVKEGMSEAQTIKTMVHEISHAKLHNPEKAKENAKKTLAEVLADTLNTEFTYEKTNRTYLHPYQCAAIFCESEEIARKMTENIADADEPVDLEAAEETAKEDVIAQREEALQRELEEAKRRTRKLVDPLQYEFSIDAEDLINYEPVMMWEMLPPSEKQLQTLEKFTSLSEG